MLAHSVTKVNIFSLSSEDLSLKEEDLSLKEENTSLKREDISLSFLRST